MIESVPNKFTPFEHDVHGIELPDKFTYPFYYEPHSLARLAAEELMEYLDTQNDWIHNFGLDDKREGDPIGKMFGVLVVKNKKGQLGYLSAFSGKLADSNYHERFVPPVFDLLKKDGFFKKEEAEINKINKKIEELEADGNYKSLKKQLKDIVSRNAVLIQDSKSDVKEKSKARKAIRSEAKKTKSDDEFQLLHSSHKEVSLSQQHAHKQLVHDLEVEEQSIQTQLSVFQDQIDQLKQERKDRSATLQNEIFEKYTFLNQKAENKSLKSIFTDFNNLTPPSGAGECAAPKLLQYAYINEFEPVCMAEFWWGVSPNQDIRRHKDFYPSCNRKCRPILGHMLQGLNVEENPLLEVGKQSNEFIIYYEDDDLLIINKEAEVLSVPGKRTNHSIQTMVQQRYPGAMLAHRLDMSTSGILLVAKYPEAYKNLQQQFINRTVKKRYVALLENPVKNEGGLIDLPLRVNLDDRPRQLVCYDYGKKAITRWKVIENNEQNAKVYFYPHTGRTHQLRVHAAHQSGLENPIVGDDLYGAKGERLMLHAEQLSFRHPRTNKNVKFTIPAPF